MPDASLAVPATPATPQEPPSRLNKALCPANPADPLLEPEALSVTHTETDRPGDYRQASLVATGKGVIVAIDGMNDLAGNPNFVRPDGSHVVIDAPDYTAEDERRRVLRRRLLGRGAGPRHVRLLEGTALLRPAGRLHVPASRASRRTRPLWTAR